MSILRDRGEGLVGFVAAVDENEEMDLEKDDAFLRSHIGPHLVIQFSSDLRKVRNGGRRRSKKT